MSKKNDALSKCCCKAIIHQDFCKHHIEKHQYDDNAITIIRDKMNKKQIISKCIDKCIEIFNIKLKEKQCELDDNYLHGLFGISSSWNEVQFIYWIYMDSMWWDIRTLLGTLAFQLNQSEYEKPFPTYPENPFTRKLFDVNDLITLRNHIKNLRKSNICINVNMAVDIFLSCGRHKLKKFRTITDKYNMSMQIITEFYNTMRYKIINYTNSQGCYCGYWVKKDIPQSLFEQNYEKFKTLYYMGDRIIIARNGSATRKIIEYLRDAEKEEFPF
jgi:hypothetical protein